MLLNLSLALFKGAVGYFSRSQAMLADAFNSAEDHPYGHGKAETLAQNIVGLLIIFTGAYLAFSSLFSLRNPITEPPASSVEEGHNVAHDLEEKLCLSREEILAVHVHVGPCKEE